MVEVSSSLSIFGLLIPFSSPTIFPMLNACPLILHAAQLFLLAMSMPQSNLCFNEVRIHLEVFACSPTHFLLSKFTNVNTVMTFESFPYMFAFSLLHVVFMLVLFLIFSEFCFLSSHWFCFSSFQQFFFLSL